MNNPALAIVVGSISLSALCVLWITHLTGYTKTVRASCISNYLWDTCTYKYNNETYVNWFIMRDYMKTETSLWINPQDPHQSCDPPMVVIYWILASCVLCACVSTTVYAVKEMLSNSTQE